MRRVWYALIVCAVIAISSPYAHAGGPGFDNDVDNWTQDDDDGGYDDGAEDDDSNEIPLDGGLSFLAVAGAGLGIKKLRDNRKKKQDSE